ncbi:MAG: PhzF family phenazine biosynthesis protein [Thiobacillus sp.]
MKLRQYQVDAFASRVFEGNPAAVCPLESWLDDDLMQAIAEENNLSETAFFVPADKGFDLRWFTPASEVDLCGHATLAAAHVLFEHLHHPGPHIAFNTRSGTLTVRRKGALLEMDFPIFPPKAYSESDTLARALGRQPAEVLRADDYLAVFEDEAAVRAVKPDFALLNALDLRGVIVTAPGDSHDFVSRFFAPRLGVVEDPVTGSAHCTLAPYWASRLGKQVLSARQVSKRGGELTCELKEDRVLLAGAAVTVLQAEMTL